MTDAGIRQAKPKDKEYFLSERGGLRVRIGTNGSKTFQMRYTFKEKRKIITIGSYPAMSLLEARNKAEEYKILIAKNIDPQNHVGKTTEEQEQFFAKSEIHLVVDEWLQMNSKRTSPKTSIGTKSLLYRYFLPHFCKYDSNKNIISSKPISDINRGEVIDIVTKLQNRLPDGARRMFNYIKNIWDYAVSKEFLENNTIRDINTKHILIPKQENHFSKITDIAILGELLRAIDTYKHSIIHRCALQFVALVPLRAGNLAKLRWKYIDFEKKILTIPRSEMKVKNSFYPDFSLPLSPQAIKVLEEVEIYTGWGEWVFHAATTPHKPLVYESLNKVLRSLGFSDKKRDRKQTIHSFRGTFRSLCDTYHKEHNVAYEIKEAALDHRFGNVVTKAYSHKAEYTEQIRPLLCWWADFLDEVKKN